MNMASVRLWHSYIGFFIAPSVLFLSLTGAVQLFSLHEAHGKYQPPAVIEKLSSVHKDQVFAFGDHHARPADAGAPTDKEDEGDKLAIPTLFLKCFFLLVALCLTVSTVLGLWIGLTQPSRKRIGWMLVLGGSLIPVLLLLF